MGHFRCWRLENVTVIYTYHLNYLAKSVAYTLALCNNKVIDELFSGIMR